MSKGLYSSWLCWLCGQSQWQARVIEFLALGRNLWCRLSVVDVSLKTGNAKKVQGRRCAAFSFSSTSLQLLSSLAEGKEFWIPCVLGMRSSCLDLHVSFWNSRRHLRMGISHLNTHPKSVPVGQSFRIPLMTRSTRMCGGAVFS